MGIERLLEKRDLQRSLFFVLDVEVSVTFFVDLQLLKNQSYEKIVSIIIISIINKRV